tara:strand:+ start:3304 stop:3420 length:117 start_codon:yes stop_codon:yes gene_type:complete
MTAEEEILQAYKRLKDVDKVADELNFPREWITIVTGKK